MNGRCHLKAMREKAGLFPATTTGKRTSDGAAQYGTNYFNGPFGAFAADAVTARVMALMTGGWCRSFSGDNANLSASMAKAIGACLKSG